MFEIARTPHFVVLHEPLRRIVRIVRTSVAFGALAQLEASFASIEAKLRSIDKPRYGLLIDAREGPFRTDPSLDRGFERYRERIVQGYQRVAVVVSTAVGRVQVERHSNKADLPFGVFYSEPEAVDFLQARPGTGPIR